MCTNLGLLCIGCILLSLSIETTEGSVQCLSGDFRCHDGEKCIRGTYRCDGDPDCEDESDEKDCNKPIVDNFLLVSVIRPSATATHVRPQIYQLDLAGGHPKPLLPTDPSVPAALAIDHRRKVLYYVDRSIEMISSVSLDNVTSSRVIFRDSSPGVELEGLAIDSTTQKLYFCDGGKDPKVVEISLTDEDRTQRIIYSSTSLKPRAIIVDEANRELYWTDWGTNPGIFVIGIEPGAQRRALITHNIVTPNALAIDFTAEVMYWIDAHLDRIESAKLSGQDRTMLFQEARHMDPHYYAMALGPQVLYIADWTKGCVQRFNLRNKTISEQNGTFIGKKTGIAFYSSSFNNTPRRRPDRASIPTYVPTYTIPTYVPTSAISEEMFPTKSTRVSHDYSSTVVKKNETKHSGYESIVQEPGLSMVTVVTIAAVGLFLLLFIVCLVSWLAFRKNRKVQTEVTMVSSGATFQSGRGRPLPDDYYLVKPNSYECLPDCDGQFYTSLNASSLGFKNNGCNSKEYDLFYDDTV